jgi:hypothetical protein
MQAKKHFTTKILVGCLSLIIAALIVFPALAENSSHLREILAPNTSLNSPLPPPNFSFSSFITPPLTQSFTRLIKLR